MYYSVFNMEVPFELALYLCKPILDPEDNQSCILPIPRFGLFGCVNDDNHVNQLVQDNGGFENGWCQLANYWVVNDEGMQSPFFQRLAMHEPYYSLPTEPPAFLAGLPVGGKVQ